MIWNAFLLAVRQICRNPMRSLLTVLGVVIGVAAVITMVTLGNGATNAIRSEIESFGMNQIMLRPGMRLGPGQKVGAPDFKVEDGSSLNPDGTANLITNSIGDTGTTYLTSTDGNGGPPPPPATPPSRCRRAN